MADAGQGVVLTHDRDGRSLAGLDRPDERGVHAGNAALDLQPLRGQELGQPGRRLDFLESDFRVAVDPARQRIQFVAQTVDLLGDLELEIIHGFSSQEHLRLSNLERNHGPRQSEPRDLTPKSAGSDGGGSAKSG
jgi:hypothetical protein